MPVTKELLLSEVKDDAQVRHSALDIQELADSINLHGVLQNPAVQSDLTVLYGHRRLAAMRLLGWKKAYFLVYEQPLTAADIRVIQLVENLQRVDLPAFDVAVTVRSLHENAGLELKEIARRVGKSPAWGSRMMTPWRCVEEVQEAFRVGAIGITDCEALAKLTPDEQPQMLASRRAGEATRDDLARRSQRRRNGTSNAVRVNRIRFPLPRGVTITLVGHGLAMDIAIDSLLEGAKAMKKGQAEGFDAKTFQAAMACKAKGG